MKLTANLLGVSLSRKPEGGFDLTCISPTGDGLRFEVSEIPESVRSLHVSKTGDGLEFVVDA